MCVRSLYFSDFSILISFFNINNNVTQYDNYIALVNQLLCIYNIVSRIRFLSEYRGILYYGQEGESRLCSFISIIPGKS